MFPDQIIYTANGDLITLAAILNGVAMICQENLVIWGFALVAAMWGLVSAATSAGLNAGAGGDLTKRVVGLLIPFAFAIMLTHPGMKTPVTAESGLTGATTSVDNVPVIITFVPATASLVSKVVGERIEAAMQSTGTDYPSLSATHNGFINPLKTLLTSRTAVLRLGGIVSEVNSLLSTCLNSDSGADYSKVASRVLFAGNLAGADAGPPAISVWSEVGSERTSIGMLLAEAAQNATAVVTDIQVGTNHIASCADAAAQVGANIELALRSDEFRRVVQGAVNTADQPNVDADYSINGIARQYGAVRTASMTTGGLAGGVAQANAEVINLLFAELVKNDLNCLRADSTNKSTCLAMAVQANEIERNNIQAAANGFESLMYAGAFANQIIAVIIGLGPAIVMFMMWAGVGAGKNMKVAAHMIVWPLLVMNLGAEIINGMIYMKVSNFLRALSQDGVINQSMAVEVYKNFSLEIGTASALMATLPILMSTIFALGGSAAMVKISDAMTSGSKDQSKSVTPAPINNTPLLTNSSVAKAEQGIGGTNVSFTGAIPAVASSAQFGSMQREAANSITSAHQKVQTISAGQSNLASWTKAFSTGDFKKVGVTESTLKALRDEFNRNYTATQTGRTGQSVDQNKENYNSSQSSAYAGVEATVGTPGGKGLLGNGVSATAGADHRTSSGASDALRSGRGAGQEDTVAKSQALAKSLSNVLQSDKFKNIGTDETKSLQHSLGVQKQYATTLSESKSVSDVATDAVKRSSGFVALNAQIGGKEIAHQMKTNAAYQRFQLNEGHAFGVATGAEPYLDRARQDMKSGVTDRIVGDDRANEALARHRGAFLLASDERADPVARLAANEYLLRSANAMLAARFSTGDVPQREHFDVASPTDQSGVNAGAVIRQATPNGKPTAGNGEPGVAERLVEGDTFAVDVGKGVAAVSRRVSEYRKNADKSAGGAGLSDENASGTNARALRNVSGSNSELKRPE